MREHHSSTTVSPPAKHESVSATASVPWSSRSAQFQHVHCLSITTDSNGSVYQSKKHRVQYSPFTEIRRQQSDILLPQITNNLSARETSNRDNLPPPK